MREDKLGLSEEAYYFIGGIMKHMKGMTVITNPIVNSYKRFVPGYEGTDLHYLVSYKQKSAYQNPCSKR